MIRGDISDAVAPSIYWVAEHLVFVEPEEKSIKYKAYEKMGRRAQLLKYWSVDEYARKVMWDIATRFDIRQHLLTAEEDWLEETEHFPRGRLADRVDAENLPLSSVTLVVAPRSLAARPDVARVLDPQPERAAEYGRTKGLFVQQGDHTYHGQVLR